MIENGKQRAGELPEVPQSWRDIAAQRYAPKASAAGVFVVPEGISSATHPAEDETALAVREVRARLALAFQQFAEKSPQNIRRDAALEEVVSSGQRADDVRGELVVGKFYWIWIALDPDADHEWENDFMPARFAGYADNGKETWNFLDSDADEWPSRCTYHIATTPANVAQAKKEFILMHDGSGRTSLKEYSTKEFIEYWGRKGMDDLVELFAHFQDKYSDAAELLKLVKDAKPQ